MWAAIALATLGTVVGDHTWYLIGRFKGRRLFALYWRGFRLVRVLAPRTGCCGGAAGWR